MSHSIHTTEGVVLRVTPFRDYDQIITIFTPDLGVIKVMLKKWGGSARNGKKICMPLSRVEVGYREGNSEIFSCYGLQQVDSFFSLRGSFLFLEVGCDLLQTVLDSQFMGKGAPDLYVLLNHYLKRIPIVANPWVLAASFRLKVLKHEGFYSFPFRCASCGLSLVEKVFLEGGESVCEQHRLLGSKQWDLNELQTVYRLADSQSFQEIAQLDLSPKLQREVTAFFNSHYLSC